MHNEMLRGSWLTGPFHQVVELRDYRQLVAETSQSTLFNDWDWMAASADHLDKRREHLTLVVRGPSSLAACVPMTWGWQAVAGVPARTLRFLGAPYADRVSLLARESEAEAFGALLAGLTSVPRQWDVLHLTELSLRPGDSELLKHWAVEAGLRTHWRLTSHCPQLALAPGSVPQPRRSNVRREITRRRRKLEDSGTVAFRHIQPEPDVIEQLVRELKWIEDQSWKGHRRLGIFSTDARLRFFLDVLARFARDGTLLISDILIDRQRVGYCLGFIYRDTYLYYTPAYLPAFAASGVGRLLLDDLIRYLSDQGVALLDASRTSLKDRHPLEDWDVTYADHYEFQAFARTPLGELAYTMQHRIKPPVKKVWRRLRNKTVLGQA